MMTRVYWSHISLSVTHHRAAGLEQESDGRVSFDSAHAGLRKFSVNISRDDWHDVTRSFLRPGIESLDETVRIHFLYYITAAECQRLQSF